MEIGALDIEVVRKEIKNIHLSVYPPRGKVRLAAPKGTNEKTIRLYAISKLGWIRKQQRKFARMDRQSEREFVDRETHYLFGRRFLLKIIESNKPQGVRIKSKTILELSVKPGANREQRAEVLESFYREELKKHITDLLDKWQLRTGIRVHHFGVKKMKTKWGTCNQEARRIWLNLELAKKPVNCIEYILVHEMIHIRERLHNDRFHVLMKQHLPRWKHLKDELNRLPVSHID
jgi:predicted metal-dependent hydrolase